VLLAVAGGNGAILDCLARVGYQHFVVINDDFVEKN
jgi:hypothetical protein